MGLAVVPTPPEWVWLIYSAEQLVFLVSMARFRGQGAFEYLLILGGSVLIAAIVIMIVQGSAGQANNAITDQTHSFVDFLQNMSNVSH